MNRSNILWILILFIVILGIALYLVKREGFQTKACSSILSEKYDGTNTVQSFLDLPVPNNLSLTGRYVVGTGGSVLVDMVAYEKQREVIDRVATVFVFLEAKYKSALASCADQIILEILHKYAQENALSRFDLTQPQTAFITIQQMSYIVSTAISVKTCTRNDPRWSTIENWFVKINDIYTRYYNGEQLNIDTYCSPTVQRPNGVFISLASAKNNSSIKFSRGIAQNNHQLMKLILNLMVAVLIKNPTRIQSVIDEMITHIESNKQDDLPLITNKQDGGVYNFQCGFLASESARYSMTLHYNSYYMMFLWTIFYILRAISTDTKDYLQPFYKYKHDLSLIVRNITDPSSVSTATPENAGKIYINKYYEKYMSLVNYDLTKPPPLAPTQPKMELVPPNVAETHKKNFAYFYGNIDMTIPIDTCDMRNRPVSLTGTTVMPNVDLTNCAVSSKVFVESIRGLQ